MCQKCLTNSRQYNQYVLEYTSSMCRIYVPALFKCEQLLGLTVLPVSQISPSLSWLHLLFNSDCVIECGVHMAKSRTMLGLECWDQTWRSYQQYATIEAGKILQKTISKIYKYAHVHTLLTLYAQVATMHMYCHLHIAHTRCNTAPSLASVVQCTALSTIVGNCLCIFDSANKCILTNNVEQMFYPLQRHTLKHIATLSL